MDVLIVFEDLLTPFDNGASNCPTPSRGSGQDSDDIGTPFSDHASETSTTYQDIDDRISDINLPLTSLKPILGTSTPTPGEDPDNFWLPAKESIDQKLAL